MELTVVITGASDTIYAHRKLQLLAASGVVETIHPIISGTAATFQWIFVRRETEFGKRKTIDASY